MDHSGPAEDRSDRLPWLIRRFIDPDAEIVYVRADQVLAEAARVGGRSFDAPDAHYTHRPSPDGGQWCTFETLVADYHLDGDPALARLAKIVHAADTAADLDTDPVGSGLLAIGADERGSRGGELRIGWTA